MNDTIESSPSNVQEPVRWLLLIHQLPPKPDYLRVKVRRRLQRLGAVPVRGSVYALPDTEESWEDFHWLAGEIRSEGGEVVLCRAAFLEGLNDEELRARFDSARADPGPAASPRLSDRVARGTTWVTRRNVHVDRMASAWLIRRAIDPEARFKFVAPRGYRPEPGELRFDMEQAEYTHVGEHCTFQVLLERFGLEEPGLLAIGEIIRDIDCKDVKYGRAETPGIAALIEGIAAAEPEDAGRLERAATLFDTLREHFAVRRG